MMNFVSHPSLQQCLMWLREFCLEIGLGLALMVIVAMQLHWWLDEPLFQGFFIQPLQMTSFMLSIALLSGVLIKSAYSNEDLQSNKFDLVTWFCNGLLLILIIATLVLQGWSKFQVQSYVLSWFAMFTTWCTTLLMYFANAYRNEKEDRVSMASHVLYQTTQSVALGSCLLVTLWVRNSDMQFYLSSYLKVFVGIHLIAIIGMAMSWILCKLWAKQELLQIQQSSDQAARQSDSIWFNIDISTQQYSLFRLLAFWFAFIFPMVLMTAYLWFAQDRLLVSFSFISLLFGLSFQHWMFANQRKHAAQLQWLNRVEILSSTGRVKPKMGSQV